ncbi:MAG: PaaI family thioesterase [Acidimicrobiales bacterium]
MTTIDELIAASPYYRYLGLRYGPAGTVVLPADPRNIGDHTRSVLHGGVLAAFLEAAGSLHLRASGAIGAATIECSTDFLRAAPVTDTTASVTVVRRGRRVAHLRIDAWQDDASRLVAVAHGSWLV